MDELQLSSMLDDQQTCAHLKALEEFDQIEEIVKNEFKTPEDRGRILSILHVLEADRHICIDSCQDAESTLEEFAQLRAKYLASQESLGKSLLNGAGIALLFGPQAAPFIILTVVLADMYMERMSRVRNQFDELPAINASAIDYSKFGSCHTLLDYAKVYRRRLTALKTIDSAIRQAASTGLEKFKPEATITALKDCGYVVKRTTGKVKASWDYDWALPITGLLSNIVGLATSAVAMCIMAPAFGLFGLIPAAVSGFVAGAVTAVVQFMKRTNLEKKGWTPASLAAMGKETQQLVERSESLMEVLSKASNKGVSKENLSDSEYRQLQYNMKFLQRLLKVYYTQLEECGNLMAGTLKFLL